MDIELGEPRALAGFDIERYRPALVCIEVHPQVRQDLISYFHRHHYVLVGKYLGVDAQNLYFMPDPSDHLGIVTTPGLFGDSLLPADDARRIS